MTSDTVQLTTAQAIIRWLSNQYIDVDGKEYSCNIDNSDGAKTFWSQTSTSQRYAFAYG